MLCYPKKDAHGRERTPWAVHCLGGHGLVYLFLDEYTWQNEHPSQPCKCPICGGPAEYDAENKKDWELLARYREYRKNK